MLKRIAHRLKRIFKRCFENSIHKKLDFIIHSLSQSPFHHTKTSIGEEEHNWQLNEYQSLIRLNKRQHDWHKDLVIYDIGMNGGEDTEYYLAKGFRVVAVDANPFQCQRVEKKLEKFINTRRLKILNLGVTDGVEPEKDFFVNTKLSAWSSFNRDLAGRKGHPLNKVRVQCSNITEIIKQWGEPYYIKVDVEGSEAVVINELMKSRIFPPYLSVSGGAIHIDLLLKNGYDSFKYIPQEDVNKITPRFPPREGVYVDREFEIGSSGPFGEDTPGEWDTYESIYVKVSQLMNSNNLGINPNMQCGSAKWHDLHVRHQAFESKIIQLTGKVTLPALHFLPNQKANRIAEGGIRTRRSGNVTDNSGLVSIITVVKNNAETIERCLSSIENQRYKSIEHIIIDGGSNDGTLEIINKWENKIDYYVSEPDNGLYEAMNKGIQCARGEFIAILNSDDWLEEDGLYRSVEALTDSNADFSVGYANVIDANGKNIHTWKIGNYDERILVSGMSFCHQAVVARKHCYEVAGLYDTNYKISADYKWVKRMFLSGLKAVFVERPIVNFSYTGLTVSARSVWKEECANQLIEHFDELTLFEARSLIEFIYRDQKLEASHFDVIRKLQDNRQFMLSFGLFLSQRIIEYEQRLIK